VDGEDALDQRVDAVGGGLRQQEVLVVVDDLAVPAVRRPTVQAASRSSTSVRAMSPASSRGAVT